MIFCDLNIMRIGKAIHSWGWKTLPKNMNILITEIHVDWVQSSLSHLSLLFLSLL